MLVHESRHPPDGLALRVEQQVAHAGPMREAFVPRRIKHLSHIHVQRPDPLRVSFVEPDGKLQKLPLVVSVGTDFDKAHFLMDNVKWTLDTGRK
jgi:hypothetical protein